MGILKVGDEAERTQRQRMVALRANRDQTAGGRSARRASARRRRRAEHHSRDARLRRAYATLFEIRQVLERVYGTYREPVFF